MDGWGSTSPGAVFRAGTATWAFLSEFIRLAFGGLGFLHSMKMSIDGFVFDLDGTIYLGEFALPGAVDCILELRRRGKSVVFISNKPLEPGSVYADKLTRLGIPTTGQVITSARVLGQHLAIILPDLNYFVSGEEPIELRSYGLKVINPTPTRPKRSDRSSRDRRCDCGIRPYP